MRDEIYSINIELTARCRAKCNICARENMVEPETMDITDEIISKIINDLINTTNSKKLNQVIFAGWGEPLLHPKVFEIINRIDEELNIPVKININGLMSTTNKLQKLVKTNVGHIIFSLNAVDDFTYNKLMMKGQFVKSLKKLEMLINFRNEAESKAIIRVQLSNPWKRNYSVELSLILDILDKLRDEVLVREIENKLGLSQLDDFEHQKIINSFACPTIWNGLTIDCSGGIYICCNSLLFRESAGLYMGNIKDINVSELLSQSPREKFIEQNKTGQLNKIKECSLCNMPYFYQQNVKDEWLQ
ncbi:MAG: radical SAM protein [Bacteroidetes bacterium]|nr:radical SAM protein [Bacteroidota bacterium]